MRWQSVAGWSWALTSLAIAAVAGACAAGALREASRDWSRPSVEGTEGGDVVVSWGP